MGQAASGWLQSELFHNPYFGVPDKAHHTHRISLYYSEKDEAYTPSSKCLVKMMLDPPEDSLLRQ